MFFRCTSSMLVGSELVQVDRNRTGLLSCHAVAIRFPEMIKQIQLYHIYNELVHQYWFYLITKFNRNILLVQFAFLFSINDIIELAFIYTRGPQGLNGHLISYVLHSYRYAKCLGVPLT